MTVARAIQQAVFSGLGGVVQPLHLGMGIVFVFCLGLWFTKTLNFKRPEIYN